MNEYELTSSDIINLVNPVIQVISRILRQTRSLYAHCILASFGDDYLEFDPRKVQNRLRAIDNVVIEHTALLQRSKLMSDFDNDAYLYRVSQYIISLMKDNNQICFLIMLREKGLSNPIFSWI